MRGRMRVSEGIGVVIVTLVCVKRARIYQDSSKKKCKALLLLTAGKFTIALTAGKFTITHCRY